MPRQSTNSCAVFGDVRILLVDRSISAAHVRDHALRTGLIAELSGAFEQREVLGALTGEFAEEAAQIRQSHAGRVFINDLSRDHARNVDEIARFLRTSPRAGGGRRRPCGNT